MRLALLWIHDINNRSKLFKNGMYPYIFMVKWNNIALVAPKSSNEHVDER